MRDHHTGYRQASKRFGIPVDQIERAAKASAKPPVPGPGAGNQHEGVASLLPPGDRPPPPEPPDFDPLGDDPEEVIQARILYALAMVQYNTENANPSIAHRWEGTFNKYRRQLDDIREAKRKADEARGRDGQQDPVQLARRIAKNLPNLSKIAPQELESACEQALRVMGRVVVPRGETWTRKTE